MTPHVLEVRASFGVSDLSSPSCAFSLMVSGLRLALALFYSECCGNCVNEKRFALQRILMFKLSKVHRQRSAFITCFVQAHCIMHVQFVSCLCQKGFDVRFRSCDQKVIDVSSCCLIDVFSTWFKRQNQQPSYRDCSISVELVRTFALCVSHALGTPLRAGTADTASQMWSDPSSAAGGGSIQTWPSVPSGFLGNSWKAPLQSPIAATCPFRTASTNIISRRIIAGAAEKKSSFPFRVCSYPRFVELAFAPSSCMVSTQRPVKGLVSHRCVARLR